MKYKLDAVSVLRVYSSSWKQKDLWAIPKKNQIYLWCRSISMLYMAIEVAAFHQRFFPYHPRRNFKIALFARVTFPFPIGRLFIFIGLTAELLRFNGPVYQEPQ